MAFFQASGISSDHHSLSKSGLTMTLASSLSTSVLLAQRSRIAEQSGFLLGHLLLLPHLVHFLLMSKFSQKLLVHPHTPLATFPSFFFLSGWTTLDL